MGLELVELLMSVEERFGVKIDDDSVSRAVTAGDLCYLIQKQLIARSEERPETSADEGTGALSTLEYRSDRLPTGPAIKPEEVWPILREIIARTFLVPADGIVPTSRFMEDLGAG